jgi:hypothetical protein
MKALSRNALLSAGIALIAATNAVILAGAAYNRSGEPEAELTLTQRETQIPYDWGFERENSGLSLSLQTRMLRVLPANRAPNLYALGVYAYGDPQWLDRKKLTELGFDLSTPANDPSGERRYRKQLPKPAFLALEMDGEAYREALKRMEEFATREPKAEVVRALQDEKEKNSRLFIVDAGLDAAALRAKYPDRKRFAIVHGKVWLRDWGAGSEPVGGSAELDGGRLNVPLQFHPAIVREKGYELGVAFGRRLEPWVTAAAAK